MESRIGLIHVGEERANVGKGDLHRASPDGSTAFGCLADPVLGGEDFQEVDFVAGGDPVEERVLSEVVAKGHPLLLGLRAGRSGRSHDCTLALFVDSEESITCIVASVGRQKRQERC